MHTDDAWGLALVLLITALRRGRVESITFGPIGVRIQEAVQATASAARAWKAEGPGRKEVDVPRIRATINRAFEPEVLDNMTGKLVLWVDDNPANNELAVRALRKFNLEVEQVTSTEAAMAELDKRVFHLVISDMGRGMNMRAGYELLHLIRESGNQVPFFIFAGSDTPGHRREAAARGAQLSTNDMLELVDNVVKYLGEKP
ncbi:MAG: response regulator [Hyphomicrobiaceae bacterium]|nr:response regulator [Hyphomicrobiaceae bacterium]